MKFTCIFLFCIVGLVSGQIPNVEWQRTVGGLSSDSFRVVKNTPDGGFIFAGQTGSGEGAFAANHGSSDVLISKYDGAGTLQWQKILGGPNYEYANNIQNTADGGYILVGVATSNSGDVSGNHGGEDVWVVKLTATGTIEWQKSYGGTNFDYGFDIKQTTEGGYVFAGYTGSNNGDVSGNHGNYDYWVVKLTATGTIEWQKTLGGTNVDYGQSIQLAPEGGYIVAGYAFSNNGNVTGNHSTVPDAWVVKLSATGTLEWQKAIGGTMSDYVTEIEKTPDNGYVLLGYTSSNDGDVSGLHDTFNDGWVVKLSNTGTIEWQRVYGGNSHDYTRSIKTTPEGGYVVVGIAGSNDGDLTGNHASGDCWILKLSSTGNIQWQKTLGGSGYDEATDIIVTPDAGYVVIAVTNSTDGDVAINYGGTDAWIVKLSPDALATPAFTTHPMTVTPNPTSNILTLQGDANSFFNTISITDMTGKVVLQQTQNTTQINVEALAKGMYLLQASSESKNYTTKFIKE